MSTQERMNSNIESNATGASNDDLLLKSSERIRIMCELLTQMNSVDLLALTNRLTAAQKQITQTFLHEEKSKETSGLLLHALNFMQHFLRCSTSFLELAKADARARHLRSTSEEPTSPIGEQRESKTAAIMHPACELAPSASRDAVTVPEPQVSPLSQSPAVVDPPKRCMLFSFEPVEATPPKSVLHGALSCSASSPPGHSRRILLQPGVYYENINLENCGFVELSASHPGARVVVCPLNRMEPVVRVEGRDSCLTTRGILFVSSPEYVSKQTELHSPIPPSSKSAPLLSVSAHARLVMEGCHLYCGGGGGVVGSGFGTRIDLDMSLLARCLYAGVYVHHQASLSMNRCKIKNCEVGVRSALGARFSIHASSIQSSESDGIVVHRDCIGIVERSSVFSNGGNGVLLCADAELSCADSTVEQNAMYGIQRTRGSRLRLKGACVRDNGLLPVSEEEEEEEFRPGEGTT